MILKGKAVAEAIKKDISKDMEILRVKGLVPTLCLIRVGEKPDDVFYEKSIEKKAFEVGVKIKKIHVSENIGQKELEKTVEDANIDEKVSGILIFRPLPMKLDERAILNKISPEKDVDGVTPISSAGVFMNENTGFPPCTAEAVIKILEYYEIKIAGADITVMGRSQVIGKPVAQLLTNMDATVTLCHSKTKEAYKKAKEAEILISAVGKAYYVNESFTNPSQTVVDVGINWDGTNEKIVGDVDFEQVSDKVRNITPVPGGIGTITTYLLLQHTVKGMKAKFTGK